MDSLHVREPNRLNAVSGKKSSFCELRDEAVLVVANRQIPKLQIVMRELVTDTQRF